MHVDHCVGVAPLLSTIMSVFSARAQASNNDPNKVRFLAVGDAVYALILYQLHIEIYGTPGLRQLIRTTLSLTHMSLSGKYRVHELHTSATITADGGMMLPPHGNEFMGRDVMIDDRGFWEDICAGTAMRVDAGTIEHRGVSSPLILPVSYICFCSALRRVRLHRGLLKCGASHPTTPNRLSRRYQFGQPHRPTLHLWGHISLSRSA
jgi:hypothetical protein